MENGVRTMDEANVKELWWRDVVSACLARSEAIRAKYEEIIGPSSGVGVLPMACELIRRQKEAKFDFKVLPMNKAKAVLPEGFEAAR